MNTAIIIMSKVPLPGHTKTRLMPELSSRECVEFHRACLNDMVQSISHLGWPVYLYYAPAALEENSNIDWQDNKWWGLDEYLYSHITMYPQLGKDLGERMYHAASEQIVDHDAILFLGTDLPDLSAGILLKAVELLESNDVVIGPAEDGGYYLLVIKKLYSFLFDNVPWGTSNVLAETLLRIQRNDLRVSLLNTERDIDIWEDMLDYHQRGQVELKIKNLKSYQVILKNIESYKQQGR